MAITRRHRNCLVPRRLLNFLDARPGHRQPRAEGVPIAVPHVAGERYGNQPDQVVAQARQPKQEKQTPQFTARASVTYARDVSFERSAVQDERSLLQAALDRSMGNASYAEIRQEFKQRVANGELLPVGTPAGRAAQRYTSAEMMGLEREMVGLLQGENERKYQNSMLLSHPLRIHAEDLHPELTSAQRAAVDEIFLSKEKIVGLDGVAGAGKTATLSVIRNGAEMQGYSRRWPELHTKLLHRRRTAWSRVEVLGWQCSGASVLHKGADYADEEQCLQEATSTSRDCTDAKLLVSRDEAAQMLSISQRALDYLVANRRLPTRRIGGRVLIPVADLRKYARGDHPEHIVGDRRKLA